MARERKRVGRGARGSALIKFLHPTKTVRAKWVNAWSVDRVEELSVLRREVKRVGRRDQTVIVCKHRRLNDEVYLVERYLTITVEGLPSGLFDVEEAVEAVGVVDEDVIVDPVDDNSPVVNEKKMKRM